MRTIFSALIGLCCGSLISEGIIKGNTKEWVLASITLLSFLGYLTVLIHDYTARFK